MDMPAPAPSFPSLRVIVADDKPFIRSIVQGMLLRLKAGGGQEAKLWIGDA
jgi:hypothetical protein